jgi:NADPH2:quinone reductase
MRALVPTGDPARLVEMAEVDEPKLGKNDVLVEVDAFSVNRGELFLLEDPRTGWRPGQDIAGTVVASTAGAPAVGTRVVGLADWEGWAERVALPASRVAALPQSVPTALAAALPLAGITALGLLRAAGPLAGSRLLATGAAGGVGHLLTELAANAGAEVTVVTSSAERGARLTELGAVAAVRRIEDAEGPFDVVFESVGGEALPAALQATAPGGLVLWYGQASRQPSTLDFFSLVFSRPDVRIQVFNYYASAAARDGDLATLVRLVADGRLHVEIGREESWERTAEVFTDLRHRRIRGKAVLTVK